MTYGFNETLSSYTFQKLHCSINVWQNPFLPFINKLKSLVLFST